MLPIGTAQRQVRLKWIEISIWGTTKDGKVAKYSRQDEGTIYPHILYKVVLLAVKNDRHDKAEDKSRPDDPAYL